MDFKLRMLVLMPNYSMDCFNSGTDISYTIVCDSETMFCLLCEEDN